MESLLEIYQDQLLYVFKEDQIHDIKQKALVIVKDESDIIESDDYLIMNYSDHFEDYLNFKIPTKTRKPKRMLSYQQCYQLLAQEEYGILSFQVGDYPYSVGMNHILYNGRIFFHSALKGYKLKGIGQPATLFVVNDLKINRDLGTHSYQSVAIYGHLESIDDYDFKEQVLLKLIADRAPTHPINERLIQMTQILELKMDYMSGKTHIK